MIEMAALRSYTLHRGKNMKEFLEKIKKEEKWVPNKDQVLHVRGF